MGKILFLRGHGVKNPDRELTLLYLEQLGLTLKKTLEPHDVEIVKLINCSNYEEYYPHLCNLDLQSYDLIIGYSSGANAVMRLSEENKLKNVLLIAGTFTHILDPSEKATGWFNKKWDWSQMKANVKNWYQLASTNDPYISLRQSRILHKMLGSIYFELDKQSHFSNWFKTETYESSRLKVLVDEILTDTIPFKDQLINH